MANCELCGEPMPAGEEMFKFHGYSGDCPKPPLPRPERREYDEILRENIQLREHIEKMNAKDLELEREIALLRKAVAELKAS